MLNLLWKILVSLAGAAAGTFILYVATSFVLEAWLTRPLVSRQGESLVALLDIPFERVQFPTEGGLVLRRWFFPARSPKAPAIVYAHGSGKDWEEGIPLVPFLHEAGYGVLLFSYRGHGSSDPAGPGHTYGFAESKDVEAAIRYLRGRDDVTGIGVIGYSLGAASAILAAARTPDVKAVVAVAPFACPEELWLVHKPVFVPEPLSRLVLRMVEWHKGIKLDSSCPEEAARRIPPRPLLIIQGTEDRHIPAENARRLARAASPSCVVWMVEGARHGDILSEGVIRRRTEIVAFLDAALRPSTALHSPLSTRRWRDGTVQRAHP